MSFVSERVTGIVAGLSTLSAYLYWVGAVRLDAYFGEFGLAGALAEWAPSRVVAIQASAFASALVGVALGLVLRLGIDYIDPIDGGIRESSDGEPRPVWVSAGLALEVVFSALASLVFVPAAMIIGYFLPDLTFIPIATRLTLLDYGLAAAAIAVGWFVVSAVRLGSLTARIRMGIFHRTLMFLAVLFLFFIYPTSAADLAADAAAAGRTIAGEPLRSVCLRHEGIDLTGGFIGANGEHAFVLHAAGQVLPVRFDEVTAMQITSHSLGGLEAICMSPSPEN